MKKIFTLFAVAVMAFAAQANVLTVAQSSDDDYVTRSCPVYGYWYDAEGYSQIIYPADMLQEMNGGEITKLSFYTPAGGWGADYAAYTIEFMGGEIQLSLKEVEEDNFGTEDAYAPLTGATVVATVVPTYGGEVLTFELAEPFAYNGGNLLVECAWDGSGVYGDTYFVGIDYDLNNIYVGFDYYGEWSDGTYAFLPMATFEYNAATTPVEPTEKTDAPSSQKENFVFNDGNIYYNAYTITLIPTEESDIYYRIGLMDAESGQYVYGEWMLYEEPFEVTEEGTYMVEAYAVAPDKAESDHIWDGFTVSKAVSVDELFAGKTVANVRYFNVAGQQMQQPAGLTIQVTTYTDGTTSTVKVMK